MLLNNNRVNIGLTEFKSIEGRCFGCQETARLADYIPAQAFIKAMEPMKTCHLMSSYDLC
jgi:hypothetical protein